MTKNQRLAALVLAGLLSSGMAQATLLDRGGGLLYDTVLNLTWLKDANYAKTSGYDADGKMTWVQANAWAENLVFGGFSDWRLTKVTDSGPPGCNWASFGATDCGFDMTPDGNELVYMYYVTLGLHGRFYPTVGGTDPTFGIYGNGTQGGQTDLGLVNNLQSSNYWTGTTYVLSPGTLAWVFGTGDGFQNAFNQTNLFYAWAVRDGDVIPNSPAPEPESLALITAALGLIGLARRRRHIGKSRALRPIPSIKSTGRII